MSVESLSTTYVNVYSVITTQDSYGANEEQYYLKYGNVKVRVRQKQINYESFIDGKEQNISGYRIYFPRQLSIITSDLVVDIVRNRKYDVKNVYKTDRKRHMQVDAIKVDTIINNIIYLSSSSSSSSSGYNSTSSSSSDNVCPNNISYWNGSVYLI